MKVVCCPTNRKWIGQKPLKIWFNLTFICTAAKKREFILKECSFVLDFFQMKSIPTDVDAICCLLTNNFII